MRILILNRSRGLIGGAETYLQDLAHQLDKSGHEISLGYELRDENVKERAIDVNRGSYHIVDSGSLHAAVRDSRAEIVFLHRLESADLEVEASLGSCLVQFLHDYQGACISGTKLHAFPFGTPCTRALGPVCLAHYLPHRCGGLNPVTAVALYRQQRKRQRVLRSAAAVLVASEHMRTEALRNGVERAKLFLAPLFSSQIRDACPPEARPISGELLFVGRMSKLKGIETLVEALPFIESRLNRRVRLVAAGHGLHNSELQKRAGTLGVRVEIRPWVDPDEREKLMRRADLLVVPSLWPEPFGIVGIEAAAVGLPAVAFNVGGIKEWLMPGESGEFCRGGATPRALGEAIADVLGNPRHLQKLRLGAWQNAGRFTPDAHIAVLETAFVSAFNRYRGPID